MKKLAILLCILLTSSLWAEKIRLKDGGVVRGKVVSETATEIVIANEYGNITIEKKNIAKRIREKSDIPSFGNSVYSFKKRSWPKYAFFASAAIGTVATAFLADQGTALIAGLSTGGVALIFASLDFFRYGRIPRRIRRRFSYQPALPLAPRLYSLQRFNLQPNAELLKFHQARNERFEFAYSARL